MSSKPLRACLTSRETERKNPIYDQRIPGKNEKFSKHQQGTIDVGISFNVVKAIARGCDSGDKFQLCMPAL